MLLSAAPFLIMAPRAIQKLNLLQWRWGKAILGCRYQRELKHHLVVAQCGWDLRLGTCLVLETLMYVARLELLPDSHPASALFKLLLETLSFSWPQHVGSMAAEFGLGVSFFDYRIMLSFLPKCYWPPNRTHPSGGSMCFLLFANKLFCQNYANLTGTNFNSLALTF